MKEGYKKLTTLIMFISMFISTFVAPLTVFASSTENAPSVGDIGKNNEVTNNGQNATVSAGDASVDGGVKVTKTVSKTETEGRYKVELKVEGKEKKITSTTKKDIYAVVVMDYSNSMDETSTKWSSAVAGAQAFAKKLLSIDSNAQIALVGYSGDDDYNILGTGISILADPYDDAGVIRKFDNKEFPGRIFGEPSGATNITAGLYEANKLLSGVSNTANKYIVLISDGAPTLYYDNNGYTRGEGGNTNKATYDATINMASTIKNKNITIFTIGYELDKVNYVDENGEVKKKAEDILREISTSDKNSGFTHFVEANPNSVAEAFTNIAESTAKVKAGTNAVLIDNIGDAFTVVDNNDIEIINENGKTSVKMNIGDITEKGTTKTFYIDINKDVTKGWYNTNAGFELTYTNWDKKSDSVKGTENAQVFWGAKGKVNVKYVDINTNEEISTGALIEDFVGENYETVKKSVDGYKFVEVEGNETGTISKETTNVIYKYAKLGKLVVKYVDEDNNSLEQDIVTNEVIGTSYETSAKTINGYRLVRVEGNETGSYIDGTITVTYIYEQVGTLIIRYVDFYQNDLKNPTSTTEKVGTSYDAPQLDFAGYKFIRVEGNKSGLYNSETIEVTFVYGKLNTVVARYVDENGKDIIEPIETSDVVGENYKTIKKTFKDYDFIEVIGNEEGQYKEEAIEVIYKYNKKSGKLVINYVDEDGNNIIESVKKTEKVGTSYKTTKETFADYDFVEVDGKEEGKYIDGTIEVTYKYSKKVGKLVINYVDEDGSSIINRVEKTAKVGEKYKTTKEEIDGFEFVKIVGKEEGKYIDGTIEVTYIYKNAVGDVEILEDPIEPPHTDATVTTSEILLYFEDKKKYTK